MFYSFTIWTIAYIIKNIPDACLRVGKLDFISSIYFILISNICFSIFHVLLVSFSWSFWWDFKTIWSFFYDKYIIEISLWNIWDENLLSMLLNRYNYQSKITCRVSNQAGITNQSIILHLICILLYLKKQINYLFI
jgi:hypothetical protein